MRRRRNSTVFDLYVNRVQLREPRGGWRPAVADTTLPFDGYVRRLPWKPTDCGAKMLRIRRASAGPMLRSPHLRFAISDSLAEERRVTCDQRCTRASAFALDTPGMTHNIARRASVGESRLSRLRLVALPLTTPFPGRGSKPLDVSCMYKYAVSEAVSVSV